jgi:tRNA-Thr(GGU) m(6)t(6)A37 methyltransferase TsaA
MTTAEGDLREGEETVDTPAAFDAGLWFIGRIETPWHAPSECPHRGDPDEGPVCRVTITEPWTAALDGIEGQEWLQILYFMHRSRRDLVRQNPRHAGALHGTFALRSPVRPNPVASSIVRLVKREGATLLVRGLDCVDGTPLLDVKPERCPKA